MIERPSLGETARVWARIAALSSRGPAGGERGRIGPKPPLGHTACFVASFPEAAVRSRRNAIKAVNHAGSLDLTTSLVKFPIDLVCAFGNGGVRQAKDLSRLFVVRLCVPGIKRGISYDQCAS